nr:transcription initiation factor IIB family protein [Halomarina rubra]
MHDGGLSTTIGRWRDYRGQTLGQRTQQRFARLRKHHSRAQYESTADRNRAAGLSEIRRMTGALGLRDSVREQASRLFRSAQDVGLLIGRSIEAVASASVYATCRCNRLVRTKQQIVAVSRVSASAVKNAYSVMNTELGLPTPPPHPVEYVASIASAFDLPQPVVSKSERLARSAWDEGLANGRHPGGIAASCLYLVSQNCGPLVRQHDLAAEAGITDTTLRANRDSIRQLWNEMVKD